MDEKLRIHVPHQERNDRLPWAYQTKRSYKWLIILTVLAWAIILGLCWMVKVLP